MIEQRERRTWRDFPTLHGLVRENCELGRKFLRGDLLRGVDLHITPTADRPGDERLAGCLIESDGQRRTDALFLPQPAENRERRDEKSGDLFEIARTGRLRDARRVSERLAEHRLNDFRISEDLYASTSH